ncbi:MAG: TlpA disulfide reductase family protein [Bacteroidota bacterium]
MLILAFLLSLWPQDQARTLIKAAQEKYENAESGYVKWERKDLNSVMLDTSRSSVEVYFHRQRDLSPIAARVNLDKHQLTHDGKVYHIGYLYSATEFRYLRHDDGEAERLSVDNKAQVRGLNQQFWNLPFPTFSKAKAFSLAVRFKSLAIESETDQHWVISVGKAHTLWLRKSDTLLTRIIEQTTRGDIDYYHQIDLVQQQYNQPAFEAAALYDERALPPGMQAVEDQAKPAVSPVATASSGETAPAWRLTTLQGDSLSLEDLRGKIVLLDFWYVGCVPCVKAMPHLQQIHDDYQERGVVVVGFNPTGQDLQQQAAFLQKQGISYPVVHSAEDTDWAARYAVEGWPTLFVIDREGRMVHKERGFTGKSSETKLRKVIEEQLTIE